MRPKTKTDSVSRWAVALAERRGYWRAVGAIAAQRTPNRFPKRRVTASVDESKLDLRGESA